MCELLMPFIKLSVLLHPWESVHPVVWEVYIELVGAADWMRPVRFSDSAHRTCTLINPIGRQLETETLFSLSVFNLNRRFLLFVTATATSKSCPMTSITLFRGTQPRSIFTSSLSLSPRTVLHISHFCTVQNTTEGREWVFEPIVHILFI